MLLDLDNQLNLCVCVCEPVSTENVRLQVSAEEVNQLGGILAAQEGLKDKVQVWHKPILICKKNYGGERRGESLVFMHICEAASMLGAISEKLAPLFCTAETGRRS